MIKKILIIMFVLWHAFSIAIYAMPREAEDNFSNNVRSIFLPIVRPYVLITHQWQQWNLFAPDPAQTYHAYTLDQRIDDAWVQQDGIDIIQFPQARYAKLLHHMNDGYLKNPQHIAKKLLQDLCSTADISHGTSVRLRAKEFSVLDQTTPLSSQLFTHTCE